MESDHRRPWYHGSPFKLSVIREGSTVTPDRDLARVFSHKPTTVSISDDGSIEHDGTEPGFLYRIAEDIQPGDIYPHPRSSLERGKEWLTKRELRVALIGPTQVLEQERLTTEEIADLRIKAQSRDR